MSDDPFSVADPFKNPSPYANGVVPQQHEGSVRQEEDGTLVSAAGGWREPPLRTPQPSFMDHRGLERGGVLSNMQALGTRPPKHIRSGARLDPMSRYRRGRSTLGTGGTDSARATPDHYSESTRAASALPDDYSAQSTPLSEAFPTSLRNREPMHEDDGVMEEDYPNDDPPPLERDQAPFTSHDAAHDSAIDPELFGQGEPAAAPAVNTVNTEDMTSPPFQHPPHRMSHDMSEGLPSPMGVEADADADADIDEESPSVTRQHSESKVPAFLQVAGAPVGDKIETAIMLSNHRRPDLHAMITHLHSAVLRDAELGALLAVNAEGTTNEHAHRLLRKKIGRVKRSVLIPDASPAFSKHKSSSALPTLLPQPPQSLQPVQPLQFPQSSPSAPIHTPDVSSMARKTRRGGSTAPVKSSIKLNLNPRPVASPQAAPASAPEVHVQDSPTPAASGPSRNTRKSAARPPSSSTLSSAADQVGQSSQAPNNNSKSQQAEAATTATKNARTRGSKKLQDQIRQEATESSTRSTLQTADQPIEEASSPTATAPATVPAAAAFVASAPTLKLKLSTGSKRKEPPAPDPEEPTALGRPPKRGRTGASPKTRSSRTTQADVPQQPARPQHEQAMDVDDPTLEIDDCAVCGDGGQVVCCGSCDRVFHGECLAPPLTQEEVDDPDFDFFCYHCRPIPNATTAQFSGLFGPLLKKMGPTGREKDFALPSNVRSLFQNVETGVEGEYREHPASEVTKSKRTRASGKVQALPHNTLSSTDLEGRPRPCYRCGEVSDGKRDVLPCDFCTANWHTDCLDPPMAVPPNFGKTHRVIWQCPLHVDKDVASIDPVRGNGVVHQVAAPTHRTRLRRNIRTRAPTSQRGLKNDGRIVIEDESSSSEDGFVSEEDDGAIPRLPAKSIKLDFIEKTKTKRALEAQERYERLIDEQEQLMMEQLRGQKMRRNTAAVEFKNAQLENRQLLRRDFTNSDAAMQLIKLSQGSADARFSDNGISNLIMTIRDQVDPNVLAASSPSDAALELERLSTLREIIAEREQILRRVVGDAHAETRRDEMNVRDPQPAVLDLDDAEPLPPLGKVETRRGARERKRKR